MRELLRQFPGRALTVLRQVRLDPARNGVGGWLAAVNLVVVVLLVSGVSYFAIDALKSLADQQEKSRVQLAGATAREDLRRVSEDTLTSARGLAERSILQRLVAEGSQDDLALFLKRSCVAGGADACAVFQGDEPVATSGPELPWPRLRIASREQGERFLAAPLGAPALLGAAAFVQGAPDARVYAVRIMDDRLSRQVGERSGLPTRLIPYRSFDRARVDEFTELHAAALADGRSAVRRIESLDLYASSVPVFASSGEAIALIETRLSAATADEAVGRLVRRLLLVAVFLAAAALVAGVLLGQRVTGPVRELTGAAERLAQGDFATSIPTGGTAEIGVLARTMDDMRRHLLDLTGALRRSEAEAQAVLGGIVEGVYAVDRNRIIRYLNPQAARLLGVDPQAAVGRFCGDVLKPCGRDGRRPCDYDCPILRARLEGSARAAEAIETGAGERRSVVITSANIVDGLQVQVMRAETELEAVRRARDTVLANISHEFRTPLAAQLASIELLREGLATLPPEQQAGLVASLERGTLRLTRLIDNLLESVRIESGQLGIRRQSCALDEIVEEARTLVGSLLAQRGQRLEVEIPGDLPSVEGDSPRLVQVFVNLLANASKFAPEGSTVRVGAAVQGDRLHAWVDDEGPGIPAEQAGSIFERFRRGAAEEPEPGGLGLGLWIARSIVDRHGGSIDAERTPAGLTRFRITLPLGPRA